MKNKKPSSKTFFKPLIIKSTPNPNNPKMCYPLKLNLKNRTSYLILETKQRKSPIMPSRKSNRNTK